MWILKCVSVSSHNEFSCCNIPKKLSLHGKLSLLQWSRSCSFHELGLCVECGVTWVWMDFLTIKLTNWQTRESVSSKSFLFGSETMVIDRNKYHKGSNCVSGFGQSRYLLRIMAIHFKVRIVLLCFTWEPVYLAV